MRLAEMRTRALWDRVRASAVAPVGLIVAGRDRVHRDRRRHLGATGRRSRDQARRGAVPQRHRRTSRARAARGRERRHHRTGAAEHPRRLRRRLGRPQHRDDRCAAISATTTCSSSTRPTASIYPVDGMGTPDPAWFDRMRPDLEPVVDHVRGRADARAMPADAAGANRTSRGGGRAATGACSCS